MYKILLRKQWREISLIFTTGRTGSQKSQKKRKSAAGYIVLYVICFLSLMAAFFGTSHLLADTILPATPWLYFAMLGMLEIFLGLIGSVFTTSSILYMAKDNELLLSMPILPRDILLARMTVVYGMSLLFTLVVAIPAEIQYAIYGCASAANIVGHIIATLVVNFLISTIACALGWIVALISMKLKGKSFISVLIALFFIAAYYVFYFNANRLLTQLAENAQAVGIGIAKYAYPILLLGKASTGDFVSLLLFTAIVAVLFALCLYVLSRSFLKIAIAGDNGSGKKAISDEQLGKQTAASSIRSALFKKELKRFTASATYMLNCGLGTVFMLAASVVLLIKMKDVSGLMTIFEAFPEYRSYVPVVVIAASMLLASTNTITAPSISLEGNNLWVLRTSPVKAYDALMAKVYLHITITAPPAIIMSGIASFVLGVEISDALFICLCTLLYVYISAMFGLLLNLKMPKLDWTNETKPIKQDLPVVIMLFGSIAAPFVFCGPVFIPALHLNPANYMYGLMCVLVVAELVLSKWIQTKGSKIWDEHEV